MSSGAQSTVKARRFANACDECSRRKVKCDTSTPPCSNCTRRGTGCTFTRAPPDLSKPRRAARQLKVVSERLRDVEALLEEARNNESNRDQSGQSESVIPTSLSTSAECDILKQPIPHEVCMVIELYFEQVNHFFPFFEKMPFINQVLQPASRDPDDVIPLRACVHAVMSNAYRMANFSAGNDRSVNVGQEADKHLAAALRHLADLNVGKASLLRIQALICISLSMAHSVEYSLEAASVVFAPAIRHAQILDLLGPVNASDVSSTRARLHCNIFWMIYTWDKNLSLYHDVAPLISDSDLPIAQFDVLESLDTGTISSIDNEETLNFFHARQTLARIQYSVWTRLRSPKAKSSSTLVRAAAFTELDAELFSWSIFYLPHVGSMTESQWPATVYVHIVRLYVSHFFTLLAIHDSDLSDVKRIEAHLDSLRGTEHEKIQAFKTQIQLPRILIECSRAQYKIVRSVGKGGLPWLIESLRLVPSATIIMLQSIMIEDDVQIAKKDFDRADSWIELMGHIIKHTESSDLEAPFALIMKLRDLIVATR